MLPKTIPSDTSDTCPTPVRHVQTQAPQASDTSDSKNHGVHHARAHAHTTINYGVGRVGVSDKKVSNKKSNTCGPTDGPTGAAAGVGRSEMLKTVAIAGAGTAAVQAAAASFAHLSAAGYWMLRLMRDDQVALQHLQALSVQMMGHRGLSGAQTAAAVSVALQELQYPVTLRPWSLRERAAAAGVSKSTWHRHELCQHVDWLIDYLTGELERADRKISQQVTMVVDVGQN